MILTITVIVSIITAIFLRPVEYLFQLLSSPTADSKKVQSVGQAVIHRVRRASAAAINATHAMVNHVTQKRKNIQRNIAGVESREIPTTVFSAQELARASAALILVRAEHMLKNRENDAAENLKLHTTSRNDESSDDDDSEDNNASSSESSKDSSSSTFSVHSTRLVEKVVDSNINTFLFTPNWQLWIDLCDSIKSQRNILSASEIIDFDHQWGIVHCNEKQSADFSSGTKDRIISEIDTVKQKVRKKIEKLKLATDEHTGLEIMHLLVLDTLGRDTPAAKIFEQKTAQDFKQTQMVSVTAKGVAGFILLLLNVFFAFYSMLYGFTKGVAWQRQYLLACIAQMFVEIFINETLEVVWINFCAPTLVTSEMQVVIAALLKSIGSLYNSNSIESTHKGFLNAPDYLFVSTNVAKSYPHLMESILVRTYIAYLPGEISKKWNKGSHAEKRSNSQRTNIINRPLLGMFRVVTTAVLIVAMDVLKQLATAPSELQRMFIRSSEPFFLSGIILTFYLVVDSPMNIAIFLVVFCFVVVCCVYEYLHESYLMTRQDHTMHPLHTAVDNTNLVVDLTSNRNDLPMRALLQDEKAVDDEERIGTSFHHSELLNRMSSLDSNCFSDSNTISSYDNSVKISLSSSECNKSSSDFETVFCFCYAVK